MNVYISCSSTDLEKHIDSYARIREEVLRLGHKIPADWLGRILNKQKISRKIRPLPSIKEEGIKAIERSDCLIADISIASSSVGYQIAYALSKKIPTLCLYLEKFENGKLPQIIMATNSLLLKTASYSNKSLRSLIKNFFKDFPSETLIKFNFIITPEIDEYLNWGSKEFRVSKSEFLREKVVQMINKERKEK